MKIHADFDKRVIVHSDQQPWLDSPMEGVHRRPLDRVGAEVARATSIVRYAPGSHFSPHVHTGGEEFLVLDGVFQDEHGDYPAGTYVRNPPQTKHKPGSDLGCIIFVKLWQFQPEDTNQFSVDTNNTQFIQNPDQPGVSHLPLFENEFERVSIVKIEANQVFHMDTPNGAELLVLDGDFIEQQQPLTKNSWLRIPGNDKIRGVAGPNGTRFWMKIGHLNQVDNEIKRVAKVS